MATDDEFLESLEHFADKYDVLAAAIGRFDLAWGGAEQALDICVAIIWRALGGRVHARRLPKQLELKISFLEKCFQELPELRKHRTRGLRVMARFRKLSALRHDLVHGALRDTFGDGSRYYFQKFDFMDGEIHVVRTLKFDLRRAAALENKVIDLHTTVHQLMIKVIELWRRSSSTVQIMRLAPGEKPPRHLRRKQLKLPSA